MRLLHIWIWEHFKQLYLKKVEPGKDAKTWFKQQIVKGSCVTPASDVVRQFYAKNESTRGFGRLEMLYICVPSEV